MATSNFGFSNLIFILTNVQSFTIIRCRCRPGAGQDCADPFHSNADPDPDPASQNDEAFSGFRIRIRMDPH